MSLTLEQLTTPMTRQEIEDSIYQVLAAVGVKTTTWKPGAVVRTLIVAVSLVLAAFSKLQALIAKSGFLELASGDWLEFVAYYVFGVTKLKATFASGEITVTNSGGGSYPFSEGDLIFTNPTTGKSYRNTGTGLIPPHLAGTISILAIEAGSASSSAAGAITEMSTPLVGVTCSNAAAVIGRDDESDPALRSRCSDKLGSLSPNGPWDAYSFAARNATRADGTNVGVSRVRVSKDGFGNVFVYVATPGGGVPGTVGDLSSDLGIVDEAIQQQAVPLAVTAEVASASPAALSITYEVWMYSTSGLTDAQLTDMIETRLEDFIAAQPIGGNRIDNDPGKVFVDALRAVIAGTRPEIFHVVVTLPAADFELAESDIPALETVTATAIHQVRPPEGQA